MSWALGKGMVRADFLEGELIVQEILQGKKVKSKGRRSNSGILPPSGLTSSEPGEGSCTERLSRAKEAVSHPQPPGRKGAGGVSPQFHLPPAPGSLAPPPLAKTNQSQWVIHSSRRERVLPVRVLCPKGDQIGRAHV